MPYDPYIFVQNGTFPYIYPINKNELVKKLNMEFYLYMFHLQK